VGKGVGAYHVKGQATMKVTDSKIEFSGKGPFKVSTDGDKYTFTANLANLDMGERTDHTRADFDCGDKGAHKEAVLVVDKGAVKVPMKDKEATKGSVPGKLTLRKTTKDVTVKYKAVRHGSHVVVSANFSFDYTGFKVPEICKFKGTICVDKSVTISVSDLKFQ
jgi:hypothetical protein